MSSFEVEAAAVAEEDDVGELVGNVVELELELCRNNDVDDKAVDDNDVEDIKVEEGVVEAVLGAVSDNVDVA